ncbi:MAG TPA: ergothioneine biosynthesis protein EgtB [Gemmataceae bacterium]|jgi:ergothioneine biosynthesis protein EgtB|nr:ergothioneine biosynthesis protein EgtB [Gemmataceae bacterium]
MSVAASELIQRFSLERSSGSTDEPDLSRQYEQVRSCTEKLCAPLETEDYVIQSMPDCSPTKWHLAHTSWFFETFVLGPHLSGYRPFDPQYRYLFNSYYNAVGPRWPRPQRGLLSRPTVVEIFRYRKYVDEHMVQFLQSTQAAAAPDIAGKVVLGLNHEQQHQELIVTDLKHALATNPLRPVYRPAAPDEGDRPPLAWVSYTGGLTQVGHVGPGFAFDNESPQHQVFLEEFQIASRLVLNQEFLAFVEDGGYQRPEFWLSDGWAARQERAWEAPLYWEKQDGQWLVMTLAGCQPLNAAAPLCHVSYYEADAFARWSGQRLPTEQEWESAAAGVASAGHFLESHRYHPAAVRAAEDRGPLYQLYGDVWQWTASPHMAYPGYAATSGALGEYNGKFMCNQLVLRGASCVTPRSHARLTYRNFYPPEARWQFSGIRLARDLT